MRKVCGFTLIELVVVLAMIAITLAIAGPVMDSIVGNNRSSAYANSLLSALRLARSEAVMRGEPVALCAMNDPADPSAGCASDWTGGWMLFTDSETTTPGALGGSESVLKVWDEALPGATIEDPDASSQGFVRFLPNGSRDPANGASRLRVRFAGCTGQQNRLLIISNTGFVEVVPSVCS